MTNLLIRWTMGGKCAAVSVDALSHAVEKAGELYPEADLAICHNNLTKARMANLRTISGKYGVRLVDQSRFALPVTPRKAEWLLFPGRLHPYGHEIFMDNDVVLFKRHPVVDRFLSRDDLFFASEAGHHRMYGHYGDLVPQKEYSINSGFYGVPPYFDGDKFLENFFREHGEREYRHTNPQGVVAYMIKTHPHKIVPNGDIRICGSLSYEDVLNDENLLNRHGIHFVGLNRSFHKAWRWYCRLIGRTPDFT